MQLAQCPACGNRVSPQAQSCPRCGHPRGGHAAQHQGYAQHQGAPAHHGHAQHQWQSQRQPHSPPKNSKGPIVLGIVVVGLVGLCGVLTVVGLAGESDGDACAKHDVKRTKDLYVCDEVGKDGATIELRSKNGKRRAKLEPGTRIVRLRGSGKKPETIKRKPGHVDARICILDGAQEGKTGYVQNTHFFGRKCQHKPRASERPSQPKAFFSGDWRCSGLHYSFINGTMYSGKGREDEEGPYSYRKDGNALRVTVDKGDWALKYRIRRASKNVITIQNVTNKKNAAEGSRRCTRVR